MAAWMSQSTGSPHTDQYLDFRSHHPSHVKMGLVKCLYDKARSIITNLQKCHLTKVLKQNGYSSAFISSSSLPSAAARMWRPQEGGRRLPLVMLPYTEGVCDDIRHVYRKFGMKVVFRSGQSLCSMPNKVKDALSMEKMSKVVYQVPCSCGKAYVGETVRRLETRMKEHWDACLKGALEKSVIADRAWESYHPIK